MIGGQELIGKIGIHHTMAGLEVGLAGLAMCDSGEQARTPCKWPFVGDIEEVSQDRGPHLYRHSDALVGDEAMRESNRTNAAALQCRK